jgi:hypothetical protein
MTSAKALHHGDGGVGGGAASKDDFERRVILKEEALKGFFEARFGSVERLEDGNRRKRCAIDARDCLRLLAGKAQIASGGQQGESEKNSGGCRADEHNG